MFKIDETYSDYYKTDPVKFPGGGAINSSGVDTTDGTPWLAKMFDNCVGWMQALYIKAFGSLTGISNEAENAQTSDVVRALDKIQGDNNTAERAISENTYFKKAGGTISGNTTVEGQLHVTGDLLVDGTGEEIISTELKVGADTITLRDQNPTGLASNELSGVVIHNYDGNDKNIILAVDQDGNGRIGDIDIDTRLLYSSDGIIFYEDPELTIQATIGQDEVVRDTGNTTPGGVEIYNGTTFSNDDTEAIATRDEAINMVDGYGVTWDATHKMLKTTFIPSGAVIPQNIQADTTITGIVADKLLYITASAAVTITVASAAQVGIKIRIINKTALTHSLSLTSVSINVPHILPMANVEIMWNGSAWQCVGGCAVGETFEQKPQCDSPFDVFPCSSWVELISHNAAFYRSAAAPTTLYTLDDVQFYADVERLHPVDWSGIKNADGTAGTVTDTGNTAYNSRGEEMKIYTGSWTTGAAAAYINKGDSLIAQEEGTAVNGLSGKTSDTRNSENTANKTLTGSINAYQAGNYNTSRLTTTGIITATRGTYNGTSNESGNNVEMRIDATHSHNVSILSTDTETRPDNYTVRIWKRVS